MKKINYIKLYKKLLSSKYQTKNWRKNQKWYFSGKKNECEIYQRKLLEKILNKQVKKTNMRINLLNYNLVNKTRPTIEIGGLNFTENFDGYFTYKNNQFYINLKFICDKGGSQTRTIKEVNSFIISQYNHLINFNNSKVYFINIIDGDNGYMHVYDNYKNNKASLLYNKYII